jgi:hypothetical protein
LASFRFQAANGVGKLTVLPRDRVETARGMIAQPPKSILGIGNKADGGWPGP